jgi:hypothetical protein
MDKTMSIFSIHQQDVISQVTVDSSYHQATPILYKEINRDSFFSYLKDKNCNFYYENVSSLYILRNSTFRDLKILLTQIEGYKVDIVRGSSQKAHLVSPLDLRLSAYMLAIFGLDFKELSHFNDFNTVEKRKYLPCVHRFSKKKSRN